jgi:hypothetical protein
MSHICDPEPGFVLTWPITKAEQNKQKTLFFHRLQSATMALLFAPFDGTDQFSTVPTTGATVCTLWRTPKFTMHELSHGRLPGTLK